MILRYAKRIDPVEYPTGQRHTENDCIASGTACAIHARGELRNSLAD
jgi:hypothetical protein